MSAAGHEQAVHGRRVEWLPDMDWAFQRGDQTDVPTPLPAQAPK
jgi:hypothetical protein